MAFNGEGCFIIHLHEGKKYDEEGRRKENQKKCSWLDLNLAPLCCEDSVC